MSNFGTFDNRIKYCVFGHRFSRQDFSTDGKLQDPATACLIFVPVAALDRGVLRGVAEN